jgi:hypothetical protein
MSQVTNFYPVQNVFQAMTAFSRLIELGAAVNGKAMPDITFSTGEVTYSLYVSKEHDLQGYRVQLNDKDLPQPSQNTIISAEVMMANMIAQYESQHKGKLPFVSMVKDATDSVTLFLDGSILIKSERGTQLAEMAERHPDMVTQALENILTSTV